MIERVLRHDRAGYDRHGGVIVTRDRTAHERLRCRGDVRRAGLDRLAGVYVVMSEGVVVTVGHRYRRLRRH